jgi:hypothetical protein
LLANSERLIIVLLSIHPVTISLSLSLSNKEDHVLSTSHIKERKENNREGRIDNIKETCTPANGTPLVLVSRKKKKKRASLSLSFRANDGHLSLLSLSLSLSTSFPSYSC